MQSMCLWVTAQPQRENMGEREGEEEGESKEQETQWKAEEAGAGMCDSFGLTGQGDDP